MGVRDFSEEEAGTSGHSGREASLGREGVGREVPEGGRCALVAAPRESVEQFLRRQFTLRALLGQSFSECPATPPWRLPWPQLGHALCVFFEKFGLEMRNG